MNPGKLGDLTSRLFEDGGLTPDEERDLGLELQKNPDARRLLLSYFRLEGAILEQARAGLVSLPSPARSAGAQRKPIARETPVVALWGSGLAAAALLMGLLFTADRHPVPVPAPVAVRSPAASAPAPDAPPRTAAPAVPIPDKPADAPPPAPKTDLPPRQTDPETRPPQTPEPPPEPRPAEEGSRPRDAILTELFIERAEGEVTLVGAASRTPGRAGDTVRAGQGLETGSGKSRAVLSFPDGTRIEARADTLLLDIRQKSTAAGRPGKSLVLQHGSVWAEVRPQPVDHPLVIAAPRGEARVVGTVFTLAMDADPKGTLRLDVQEGKVHFVRSSDGKGVDVGAGHSASSGQSADLVVLRSPEVIQSFQDGRYPTPDYAGTRDTQLTEKSPQTAFGGAKLLLAEAEDAKEKKKASWPLLRWDLTSVPVGSRIRSASVTLHVAEPSRGQMFYFFEPARSWTESEATWKLASAGNLWRFPGSLGAVERWSTPLGTLTPLQKGEYTTLLGDAGIALIQSWVNLPATNLGLQIAGSSAGPGFHFHSREAAAPETRPRLTIVYTLKK